MLSLVVGERPYSVRVVALNNAPEEGMAAMQVFFTKEGSKELSV